MTHMNDALSTESSFDFLVIVWILFIHVQLFSFCFCQTRFLHHALIIEHCAHLHMQMISGNAVLIRHLRSPKLLEHKMVYILYGVKTYPTCTNSCEYK